MLGELVEKYGGVFGVTTELRAQTELAAFQSRDYDRQVLTHAALSHSPGVAARNYIQPRLSPQMLRER